MTLAAPSTPDAPEHDPGSAKNASSPAALIAVVAVSALVIILCVLGATLSGLFSFLSDAESTQESAPTASLADTAAGPLARFDDGQYLVTLDVQPGTYSATVPAQSAGCVWERNSTTDGTATSVLESGQGGPGELIVVSVRETDKVFQSQGCGTWTRTAD